MAIYYLTIEVKPDKIEEFLRNLQSLWFQFLKEEDCLSYSVFRKYEMETTFFMEGEFSSKVGMDKHFQTRSFQLLVGAAGVLGKILKMMIIEVVEEGGSELAKAKIAGDSYTFTVPP